MEQIDLKRRMTAVLLADVVGYSRLMSVDEEGTHILLTDYVKDLITPKVAQYRGRLIRSMGDGLLVEFDAAVDAVRCGVEIQRGLTERGALVDIDHRIQMRIGINAGDVIVDERDIYGNSVNIAARLESLAQPGEVYVTRSVRDQLWGYPSLSFEDIGERRVKNIDVPIRVFRVAHSQVSEPKSWPERLLTSVRSLRSAAARRRLRAAALVLLALIISGIVTVAALPVWRESPQPPPRASIVVLPFNNFSDDPGQGYFADAVTDDLTTDLSRIPGTFVIARDTAFTFKGRSVDAREIGKECGVRYLLEGSVRRVGSKVETNVQLIDARSGGHVWADRFDSDVSGLFELQLAVTGRIAASLDIQLVKAEGRRALDDPPANPDAVDLRLRAMAIYISSITPEHMIAARRLLEESVRLDPNSADSWAWLADVRVSDYLNHWNGAGTEQLDQADDAVRKAVAIDPGLALAHYADGLIRRARDDHHAALEAFRLAIKLNHNFARAYAQEGNELINLGRPAEAPPLVAMAMRLNPLDPSIGQSYWILGRADFFAGDYREAIGWLQKSVEIRPNVSYNWLYLISAHALAGDPGRARKVLGEFYARDEFKGYTLSRVESSERTTPNDNAVVVAGRQQFHEGLRAAGMAEH
jgi:TolB-like protein/class 3 adenylate cyclase/Tfp pilus assembly protein PilF